VKNQGKVVVVAFSDTHINSTVGLCAPEVALDDGGHNVFSKTQRWLWTLFVGDFLEEAKQLAVGGAKIYVFTGGDTADIDIGKRSTQILSRNPVTIKKMCVTTLNPAVEMADRLFMIRGTAAHDGKSSWMEELIGEDASAEQQNGNYSAWEWNVEAAGVLWNVLHHARGDGQSPSAAGAAVRISRGIMLQCVRLSKPLPNVAVRGHCHFYNDSFEAEPVRTIILPAWTTQTEFSYRISGGIPPIADIGGVIGVCENKKVTELRVKRYRPQPKTTWRE